MFDPMTKKYPYPEDTGAHYLVVKKDDGTVFDRDYPYVDRSPSMRIRQALIRAVIFLIVFPVLRIRLGLRIKGRENIRAHREEFRRGVISVSNHVHLWDYLSVMRAAFPRKTNVLVWAKNVRGENAKLIRLVGGIPLPEGDVHATAAMTKQTEELLRGGWLHIYSEGSMWEFYRPVRPFKPGAAHLACRCGLPVLPMAFSYRKPGFIRGRIFRQTATFTLSIGEPLRPDASLPFAERRRDLTVRSHEAVCRLAGIDPAENIYPPVYDDSKRVDYY